MLDRIICFTMLILIVILYPILFKDFPNKGIYLLLKIFFSFMFLIVAIWFLLMGYFGHSIQYIFEHHLL